MSLDYILPTVKVAASPVCIQAGWWSGIVKDLDQVSQSIDTSDERWVVLSGLVFHISPLPTAQQLYYIITSGGTSGG